MLHFGRWLQHVGLRLVFKQDQSNAALCTVVAGTRLCALLAAGPYKLPQSLLQELSMQTRSPPPSGPACRSLPCCQEPEQATGRYMKKRMGLDLFFFKCHLSVEIALQTVHRGIRGASCACTPRGAGNGQPWGTKLPCSLHQLSGQ